MPKDSHGLFGQLRLKQPDISHKHHINMDERTTHDDDELTDIEDEQEDIVENDDSTSDDSVDDSSDKSKEDIKNEVKENQKKAWLDKIRSGKTTLEEMPKDLEWLKKDIKKELESGGDDLNFRISKVLSEERAKSEFEYLIDDLKESKISKDQEAQLAEEYEEIIGEFKNPTYSQKLKALLLARRLTGLKDSSEALKERRRKGMALPPLGGRKRTTINTESKADIKKKYGQNLPPGWKI